MQSLMKILASLVPESRIKLWVAHPLPNISKQPAMDRWSWRILSLMHTLKKEKHSF